MNKQNKRDYFNEQTEDAIILYNQTEDYNQKSIIYEKYIHYSFFKLTQNLIHTFKFYQTDVENLEHLQHEIIIFLLEKIHLYHQSQSIQDRLNKIINREFLEEYTGDFLKYTNNSPKITQQQINCFIKNLDVSDECMEVLKKLTPPKAYSYFGTAVKRWLILYTKKNYNNKLNFDDIDTFKEENNDCIYEIEDEKYNECPTDLSVYIDKYVEFCNDNIYKMFPKENETKIADAILELFRRRESIDIFNKKAIYVYLREIIPSVEKEYIFDVGDEKSLNKFNNIPSENIIEIMKLENDKLFAKYYSSVSTSDITKVTQKLHRIFKHNYDYYLENDYISFKY